jgi:hypothetical protein
MIDQGGSHAVSPVRNFVTKRLPVILYCIVGLGFLVQGIRYIGAAELMPYHLAVIETPWEGIGASYQTLFLGLLKGFGAGSFGMGLVIILMALFPLRAGNSWARWATPVVAAIYTGALVYVTSFALLPGATPIAVTATLHGLVIVAAVCSMFGGASNS